jgi:hypothetical protein
MSVSIFIKSWREDLKWLRYCLRFLEKNWREPKSEVVVMLDKDCRDQFDFNDYDMELRRLYVEPWLDGYSHAMFSKACADMYCMSDKILLMDSDCMLLTPADARIFTEGTLPIIPWITYDDHQAIYPHSPWQKVVEKVMKVRSEKHYMPVQPILYWANTLHDMRRHIVEIHEAEKFSDVVYSGVPFTPKNFGTHPISFVDYDCIGLYAALYEPERYVFRHQSLLRPNPFKQFHSWTEWHESTPQLFDRYLSEAVAL